MLELVPVVYTGPEASMTLHITTSPLVFKQGEPVMVAPNVRDALMALADNKGKVYGWWSDYVAPPPAAVPTPQQPTTPPAPAGGVPVGATSAGKQRGKAQP